MATSATTALPPDVRVMNATALVIGVMALALVLAAGMAWVARQPLFTLASIRLEGQVTRHNVATWRAIAAPRLAGSYFSLDLAGARAAFEAAPWVRHAVVQRVFPNRLVVRIEEHLPVALWKGDEGNDRLVNSFGEVFEANLGDVDDEALPEFSGPGETSAAEVLAMYRAVLPLLRPLELAPARIELSRRGSWSMELDSGATLELGRGEVAEVQARVGRFVRTVSQVTARQQREWRHADLRHADGYALTLKGGLDSPAAAASN